MSTLSHQVSLAKKAKTTAGAGSAEQGDGASVGKGGEGEGKAGAAAATEQEQGSQGGAAGGGQGMGRENREEEKSVAKAEEDELKHLRHSLIQIISGMCPNFDGMYTTPLSPHLPALLLPLLQSLEDKDQDLSRQARRCAELSANTPMLPGNVLPQVLGSVYLLGESKSWHVRSAVLLFLQIIAFRHQFLMSSDDELARIRELMLSLLQDSQVEVRETASAAVAVLVRICGEHLALKLTADFKEWARQDIPRCAAKGVSQSPLFVAESSDSQRKRAAATRSQLEGRAAGGGEGTDDAGAPMGDAAVGNGAAGEEVSRAKEDKDSSASALKAAIQRRSLAQPRPAWGDWSSVA